MIRSLTRALPQGNVQSLDDWVYLSTTSEPCHDMLSCRNWLARYGSLVALLFEITEHRRKCSRTDNQYTLEYAYVLESGVLTAEHDPN